MVWPQRWLGQIYSGLYSDFGRDPFTLSQAVDATGASETKLAVAFSKLHSSQAVLVFKRSRPRLYRLLDPRNLVIAEAGTLSRIRLIQERYVQLIYDVFRSLRGHLDVVSLAVFGSVARGEAGPLSDIDLLVVSDDFHGSLASRIDWLSFVDSEVEDEIGFLKSQGFNTWLSFYPMTKTEAGRAPALFLDMTQDAKMVCDREQFLHGTLSTLGAKLVMKGAKRVRHDGGSYWDLAPDYRKGQVIQI